MNTNPNCRSGTLPLISHRQGLGERGVRDLSLSRRAELASDAFVAGGIVRMTSDIVSKSGRVEATSLSLVENGIHLAERLHKGEVYLNQRRAHLIQQPESADTVRYIRARATFDVDERAQEASSVLTGIKERLAQGGLVDSVDLDIEALESTRAFFRVVHSSIMDQLGVSEISSLPADID